MQGNPVGWFEIYVNDLKRAKDFYADVFQFEFERAHSDGEVELAFFPAEMSGLGASGALCKMQGVSAGGNSTIVYFMSDDCSVEEKRVVKAGGKIMKPKMSIGEFGFMTLVYDTEGNCIGIHSMK